MTLEFDHLAVCGETLEAATAHVEEVLGLTLEPGGVHVEMGTHNRLLSLGPGMYLEAIAVNPEAAHPGRPRWFDLDRFAGTPRLTNWIARTEDLEAALRSAPAGMGVGVPLQRGKFSWTMAVPGSGCLPFGGAAPALIQWDGALHPADLLPDRGCRLRRLRIAHPEAAGLRAAFPALESLWPVVLEAGPEIALEAEIETAEGVKVLR
ncbi:VOC family protein [Ovoidimarina sediminis]|uniref:VOC family protein n=1 Tax=Ovoidimarina sediminis TaxID=3079856 RepID=UPI00290B24CD|nr:VOC family protein [Rhodophyticola sp. MJ-SS7]MDU8942302.1 VOC family protein [Rhodophyticola sp. MJ-SS7]